MALIEFAGVRKRFGDEATGRVALDDVSVRIEPGELVAVVGTSGSGKSTFLHIAGGLDVAYEGSAKLAGHELKALSDNALSHLRRDTVGFVFQGFHLLSHFTVHDNVALPDAFARTALPDLEARIHDTLEIVGLAARAHDLPTALSGGQRQRVAIARALLLKPPLLLCDEPTGSLDTQTGAQILGLFQSLHAQGRLTQVLVTHEERVADIATRILRLENGRIVSDEPNTPRTVHA